MTVIPFRKPETGPSGKNTPPLFNIPPLTLCTLAVFLLVHIVLMLLPQELRAVWGYRLAFVPARYTNPEMFGLWAFVSPFTHLFMHGGWLHIAMNGLMLTAFGAGTERMLGTKRSALLFLGCGLGGALAQFLAGPFTPVPMIGASGAISGLFAAMILRLQKSGMMPVGRFGIWGVAAFWVGLSFVTAFLSGAMGVGDVAWAAHAGGFFAGIAIMKLRYFA